MELSNLYIGAKFDTLNQQEIKEIATWCNAQLNPRCYLSKNLDGSFEIIKDTFVVTEEMILEELRVQRESECFNIINRGKLWYDNLTEQQLIELNNWYKEWLDVTITKVIPVKPKWLD